MVRQETTDPSPCPRSDLNPAPEDHPPSRLRRTHDHLSRLAVKQQRMKRERRDYCNPVLSFRM
ncbi:rCG33349 [Rattus norvegicus]|uniref:RCG33349 n=1 Tax=Rattus norvegicus TaxID=10116 RepID=A6HFE8_RAT|nr:rCG33349 [Rattus norvegicus]